MFFPFWWGLAKEPWVLRTLRQHCTAGLNFLVQCPVLLFAKHDNQGSLISFFSKFSDMVMTFWMLHNLHTVLTSSASLSVTIKHSGQKQPEGGKDLFGLHFQVTEPVTEGSHGRNSKAHPLHSKAHPLPQLQLAQDHLPRDGVWRCLQQARPSCVH